MADVLSESQSTYSLQEFLIILGCVQFLLLEFEAL